MDKGDKIIFRKLKAILDAGIQRINVRVEDPGEDDLDPTLEKKIRIRQSRTPVCGSNLNKSIAAEPLTNKERGRQTTVNIYKYKIRNYNKTVTKNMQKSDRKSAIYVNYNSLISEDAITS